MSLHQARRRLSRGFTLVELLVVIAIIGILIALLLPAVQAAREAARRTGCQNNLAQLALATQSYEAAYGYLPPGVRDPAAGPIQSVAKGFHHSWLLELLPYIEQRNTYDAIEKSLGVYDPANAAAAAVVISVLLCPTVGAPVAGGPVGTSNYAGCHHDLEAPIDVNNNGVLFLNSRLTYPEIRDGLSHTFLFGEKLLDPILDLGWISGTRSTLRNTGTKINGNAAAMPPGPPPTWVGGFESWHPAQTNFVFCDGHVRSISNRILAAVYVQLGHRADGKLLSDAAY
jgi:prepilin-type N-terminal cleavage/methylation domain-containing protein/prepilin-type processing-associated H-X9-DG protein